MKLLPLLEAVVLPMDFDAALGRLKTAKPSSVAELNKIFGNKVQFITLQQYLDMNPAAGLPDGMEKKIEQNGVGGATVADGVIYVFCKPDVLLAKLNNSFSASSYIKFISTMIRHESVHLGQIDRSGGKAKDVDQAAGQENFKKYLANPQEIMAYAQSVIDELHQQGLTDKAILKLIGRDFETNLFRMYKHVFPKDPKVMNRLRKYIYQYLTDTIEQR